MQLKHRGKTVEVTLTKPEQRLLDKTGELLCTLALIPCEQQKRAEAAWKAVTEVAARLEEEAEE